MGIDRAPRLSVIVPCYNRAAYLAVFLRALCWSAVPPDAFEVLVVDDGSVDHVEMVVEGWQRRGLDVRLCRLRAGGAPRNNARARNAGLRAARHPIVIQTDPDIVFATDVLQAARDGLAPGTFASPAHYLPLTRESTLAVALGASGPSPDPDPYLAHARGRPDQVLSPDGVGGLHGALTAWREDLLRVGGYDESFESWGWEDRELLVTLAHAGLRRVALPDVSVVHLWHPLLRGETGRETQAAAGRPSRAAWEVQMQRAAAEYPRPWRPCPAPLDGLPAVFDGHAYARWVGPEDAAAHARGERPLSYQLFLDAHRLECEALLAAGHPALARRLLLAALQRPWEHAEPDVAWATGLREAPTAPVRRTPGLDRYDRVDEALLVLARCADRDGSVHGRDRTLALLEASPAGRVAAAAMRARLALRRADVETATRVLAGVDVGCTPPAAAVAIETAVLAGRDADAVALLSATPAAPEARPDYFEQIRLAACARWLDVRPRPWFATGPAGSDRSEFLFSAGMRALREGLDLAACLVLRRFLDGRAPADRRLFDEAHRHAQDALARLRRVAGPDVMARLDDTEIPAGMGPAVPEE